MTDLHIRLLEPITELRDPILIAGFTGRMELGGTAAATAQYLVDLWDARPVAEIDAEEFFDFSAQRPLVRLVDGRRVIEWPENRIYLARPTGAGRDVLLLPGVEPHFHWRAFTDTLTGLATGWGVKTLLTLRAFPALTPHTRSQPVRVMTEDADLAASFGLEPFLPTYEGPTDIANVIEDAATRLGLTAGGLVAMIPHYLNVTPQPLGMLALAQHLARLLAVEPDFALLREQVSKVLSQADQAMHDSEELRNYVASLERQFDAIRATIGGGEAPLALSAGPELPSGEDLADAVERFFAEQQPDSPA